MIRGNAGGNSRQDSGATRSRAASRRLTVTSRLIHSPSCTRRWLLRSVCHSSRCNRAPWMKKARRGGPEGGKECPPNVWDRLRDI
jgi:hypothetical protein